jgi:hypothetical protein
LNASVDVELGLNALAAMLSPTTLSFTVFAGVCPPLLSREAVAQRLRTRVQLEVLRD